jgi:preprotein translocase subunit Sss1
METNVKQIALGMVEVIAANNVLKKVRKPDDMEYLRMVTGATMAGLGYAFGPELHDRVKQLNNPEVDEAMKERIIYAAGGAVVGMIVGYKASEKYLPQQLETMLKKAELERRKHPDQPGILSTTTNIAAIGGALYLIRQDADEMQRHLWGLGTGALGYMYGPELLRTLKHLPLPKSKANDAIQVYEYGSAVFGGLGGGLLGWYKGQELMSKIR